MCRITLIPITKTPYTDRPHPQTVLYAPKPTDQVLSPEELYLNNLYLNSHGLPPEGPIILSTPQERSSQAPVVAGSCIPPNAINDPTYYNSSTSPGPQQGYGFGTRYPPQPVDPSDVLAATFYNTNQLPYNPSRHSQNLSNQQHQYSPFPTSGPASLPDQKSLFPALVPDRVVPRSQQNPRPLKIPSTYGVRAHHCERVWTLYNIYHTQINREAEPESKKMPHLCDFVYGPNGNMFWQDGRHVGEGEAGEVMGVDSYVDGLIASDAKKRAEASVGGDRAEAGVSRTPVPGMPACFTNRLSALPQLLSQLRLSGKEPSNATLMPYNDVAFHHHQRSPFSQRVPSPRYIPADNEPLPADRDGVFAAMKRMIGVDENWNPINPPIEQPQDLNWADQAMDNGEGPSRPTPTAIRIVGNVAEEVSSFPKARPRNPLNTKTKGNGKGKGPKRQGFRHGSRATAAHDHPDFTQHKSRGWRPLPDAPSPSFPAARIDPSSPITATRAGPSTSHPLSPVIPNSPNTPIDAGSSLLVANAPSLPIPVPANASQAAAFSSPSSLPKKPDLAASLTALPDRSTTNSLPPVTTTFDQGASKTIGLRSRVSRASTGSLPCERVGSWSEMSESETPITLWNTPVEERVKEVVETREPRYEDEEKGLGKGKGKERGIG